MSSSIWRFFDKVVGDKAKSRICNVDASRKGGSTKAMWDHLKHHKEEYSTYHMMQVFREQKKPILALQYEMQTAAKRIKLDIPPISSNDFEFLRHLCPILKVFNDTTEKVFSVIKLSFVFSFRMIRI